MIRCLLTGDGVRGAVALAAVLSLPMGFPYRAQLLAMTYGAVLFTLLAQGLTIAPLVQRLGLRESAGQPLSAQSNGSAAIGVRHGSHDRE